MLLYREEGRVRPLTIMQTSDTQQTQSEAPDRFEASSRTQGLQKGTAMPLHDWCEKKGGGVGINR